MPQKASESHEEYRERQQTPAVGLRPNMVLPDEQPDPKPGLAGRVERLESQVEMIIQVLTDHHSGMGRDLEAAQTKEETK